MSIRLFDPNVGICRGVVGSFEDDIPGGGVDPGGPGSSTPGGPSPLPLDDDNNKCD